MITGAVARILVSSLATGEVPEDWSLGSDVPLFKKGNRENPGNYRRVTLTSVVGKLLEPLKHRK